MSVQNLAFTVGVAQNIDFTYANASTAKKYMLIVYGSQGNIILIKKDSTNGGSTNELAVSNGVKLTGKFLSSDTYFIPSGGTYKLFEEGVNDWAVIFNGSITVTGTGAVVDQMPHLSREMYIYHERFGSNNSLSYSMPDNAVVKEVIMYATSGSPQVTLTSVDNSNLVFLSAGQTVQNGYTVHPVDKVLPVGGEIAISSSNWESADVDIWIVFYTLPVE